MPTMDSMAAVIQECAKLTSLNQGWQFLPLDRPEEASFGMVCLRRVSPDGTPVPDGAPDPDGMREETVEYEWLPYGRRLRPEVEVATDPARFEKAVDAMRPDGIFRCDSPERRQVGFVSYAGGTARVVRIPVTMLKEGLLSDGLRTEILIGSALRLRP